MVWQLARYAFLLADGARAGVEIRNDFSVLLPAFVDF